MVHVCARMSIAILFDNIAHDIHRITPMAQRFCSFRSHLNNGQGSVWKITYGKCTRMR